MTPKCCEKCQHLNKQGSCKKRFKECISWGRWFREAWTDIYQAAQKVKNKRERRAQNLDRHGTDKD